MEIFTGPVAQMVLGLVALLAGGELLVRGASRLAAALRVSPLVIGLTVVAFGTSSPELAVSIKSAFAGNADIALGNVVGSNIINVLCILGLSALITPLLVASRLIRREVPMMVGASFLLLVLGLDGNISRFDGSLLSVGLIAYVVWSIRSSRQEPASIQSEFEQDSPPSGKPTSGGPMLIKQILWMIGGLLLLGLGSNWLVDGAVAVATSFGVSELIIGLTIVAVGTSMPEVVTSVVAAWRGERDIAVGSVVGSNLFNILCVLGLSSLIAPDGIKVSAAAIRFDIPIMITVAAACLPIFFTGNLIARWEGGLFFLYYIAYTVYLILDAVESEFRRTLSSVMLVFVIPLTVLTLVLSLYRSVQDVAEPETRVDDQGDRVGQAANRIHGEEE